MTQTHIHIYVHTHAHTVPKPNKKTAYVFQISVTPALDLRCHSKSNRRWANAEADSTRRVCLCCTPLRGLQGTGKQTTNHFGQMQSHPAQLYTQDEQTRSPQPAFYPRSRDPAPCCPNMHRATCDISILGMHRLAGGQKQQGQRADIWGGK